MQHLGKLLRLAVWGVQSASLAAACALPEVREGLQTQGVSTCSPPADRACELRTDCGCPAEQTCRVDGAVSGRTACGDVGPVLNFEPCSRESDCARRSDCIGGVCRPYCMSDADCSGPTGHCVEIATAQGTAQDIRACDRGAPCDVPAGGDCELISDCGCPGVQTCRVVAALTGRTACGGVGPSRALEPCGAESDCAWGLDCIGGLCKPYCRSDVDCAQEQNTRCGAVSTSAGDVPGARVCSR